LLSTSFIGAQQGTSLLADVRRATKHQTDNDARDEGDQDQNNNCLYIHCAFLLAATQAT